MRQDSFLQLYTQAFSTPATSREKDIRSIVLSWFLMKDILIGFNWHSIVSVSSIWNGGLSPSPQVARVNKISNPFLHPYLPSGALPGSVILYTGGSTEGFGELELHTDCAVDSLRIWAFVFKQIKYLLLCLVAKTLFQYPITYPCNPFVFAASVPTSLGEMKANLFLEVVGGQ